MNTDLRLIAPTIAQYPSYDELLANSEQVPLHEFQSLNSNQMPRFADGLFDSPPGPGLRRKRKRLSDFSDKEKQARRKLKNRIAAQSARDRKRFEADQNLKNMEELENEVRRLREDNRILRNENQQLREDNAGLRHDNMILRQEQRGGLSSSPELIKRRKIEQHIPKSENLNNHDSSYNNHDSNYSSPSSGSYKNEHNQQYSTNFIPVEKMEVQVVNDSSNNLVDPHAVERKNNGNSSVQSSKNPADGLPMPRGQKTTIKSSRMVAIQETTKKQQTTPTPTFEQMRALYTLVMTVLFQTAGTMVTKTTATTTTESAQTTATTTQTTQQSSLKELNRRLKAVQSLKEKTKLIRRLTSPLNFWETQNLITQDQQVHQTTHQTPKMPSPYFQHHRSQDKCPTMPSSRTSSKTSQKTQINPVPTKSTLSSSTMLELPSFSTGGKDQLKSKTKEEAVQQHQVCPIHSAKTQNCLACQVKGTTTPVTMSPEFLMKINISDHMLRQATQAVQRKRKIMHQQQHQQHQQQHSPQQQQHQIKTEFSEIRQTTRINNRSQLHDAAQ